MNLIACRFVAFTNLYCHWRKLNCTAAQKNTQKIIANCLCRAASKLQVITHHANEQKTIVRGYNRIWWIRWLIHRKNLCAVLWLFGVHKRNPCRNSLWKLRTSASSAFQWRMRLFLNCHPIKSVSLNFDRLRLTRAFFSHLWDTWKSFRFLSAYSKAILLYFNIQRTINYAVCSNLWHGTSFDR